MKFCSECGHAVALAIPEGDNRPRHVCSQCGTIHYQNPKNVIGTIPVWEHEGQLQILLCRRAIEPRYGYWTLPAGFMENGETTGEAAARETEEEAGAAYKNTLKAYTQARMRIADANHARAALAALSGGEGGLRHMQEIRRAREGPLFDDGHEISQLANVKHVGLTH